MGFPDVAGRASPARRSFSPARSSDYVRPAHWPRIRALFPAAAHEAIPGAGHWLHADAPDAFIGAVSAFLDAPEPGLTPAPSRLHAGPSKL